MIGFLLLGAIVNVVVTWTTASVIGRESLNQDLRIEQTKRHRAEMTKRLESGGFEPLPVPTLAFRGTFRDVMLEESLAFVDSEGFRYTYHIHRCGFPTRMATATIVQPESFGHFAPGQHHTMRIPIKKEIAVRSAIVLDLKLDLCQGRDHYVMTTTDRILPLAPIWPGFAINTMFYAAILWALFAAPGVLRRKRRLKRGLCPACAYSIGVNLVCAECGFTLQMSRESRIAA